VTVSDKTSTSTNARPVDTHELDSLVEGRHAGPHSVLGPHPHDGAVTVRALKPLASSVVVRYRVEGTWTDAELSHEHEGVWVGVLPVAEVPDYRLVVTYGDHTLEIDDPYRFLPTVGEVDQHLFR
jgi:1,4-alpha-glucan branching enzyme